MLKTSKLCLAVSALVLILFMVTIFIGCAKGEVTTPAGTTTTPKAGSVTPKAGAVFAGSIEITGKASSGTIEFSISEDGASVTSVSVTLKDLKTDSFSAGSMTKNVSGTFPITGGNLDASISGIGQIKGHFTSSTQASGTVNLTLDIPFSGTVDLGEWHWSAKAD